MSQFISGEGGLQRGRHADVKRMDIPDPSDVDIRPVTEIEPQTKLPFAAERIGSKMNQFRRKQAERLNRKQPILANNIVDKRDDERIYKSMKKKPEFVPTTLDQVDKRVMAAANEFKMNATEEVINSNATESEWFKQGEEMSVKNAGISAQLELSDAQQEVKFFQDRLKEQKDSLSASIKLRDGLAQDLQNRQKEKNSLWSRIGSFFNKQKKAEVLADIERIQEQYNQVLKTIEKTKRQIKSIGDELSILRRELQNESDIVSTPPPIPEETTRRQIDRQTVRDEMGIGTVGEANKMKWFPPPFDEGITQAEHKQQVIRDSQSTEQNKLDDLADELVADYDKDVQSKQEQKQNDDRIAA